MYATLPYLIAIMLQALVRFSRDIDELWTRRQTDPDVLLDKKYPKSVEKLEQYWD